MFAILITVFWVIGSYLLYKDGYSDSEELSLINVIVILAGGFFYGFIWIMEKCEDIKFKNRKSK